MALDHGVLNVPLAKRNGDIDKQLVQFTKERAKIRKGAHEEAKARYREEKAIAQGMLDRADPQLIAEWAAKKGMTERAFRTFLAGLVNDNPTKAQKVLELTAPSRTGSLRSPLSGKPKKREDRYGTD